MPTKVKILIQTIVLEAELFDTACAKAIAALLPMEANPNKWGDEFYFGISHKQGSDETATTSVHIGEIGYWPPGNALAIFFGPTPMSTGSEPVPASEVNIVGKITGDATQLRKVRGTTKIRLEQQ
jgi:hypothetical protein